MMIINLHSLYNFIKNFHIIYKMIDFMIFYSLHYLFFNPLN